MRSSHNPLQLPPTPNLIPVLLSWTYSRGYCTTASPVSWQKAHTCDKDQSLSLISESECQCDHTHPHRAKNKQKAGNFHPAETLSCALRLPVFAREESPKSVMVLQCSHAELSPCQALTSRTGTCHGTGCRPGPATHLVLARVQHRGK